MPQIDYTPIGYWNFTKRSPFQGRSPNWQATDYQGATLQDGGLKVSTNQYAVVTGYSGSNAVTDKTLVAWLRLGNLSARGGSALTLDSKSIDQFDGLVFAEKTANEWYLGSNGGSRSAGVDADFATENVVGQLVQIAAVYRSTATGSEIVGYRNGAQFTKTTYTTPLPTWQPGDMQVFFGLRHHVAAAPNRYLDALIVAAAIYEVALPPNMVPAWNLV